MLYTNLLQQVVQYLKLIGDILFYYKYVKRMSNILYILISRRILHIIKNCERFYCKISIIGHHRSWTVILKFKLVKSCPM